MRFPIRKRISMVMFLATIMALPLVSCTQPSAEAMVAHSDVERVVSPHVDTADLKELVEGNTAFALDLYQTLRGEEGNLIFSPYSISLALAMTYAGSRGETEHQMADTLHFTLSQSHLHPAFNMVDLELASLGEDVDEQLGEAFRLNIANSIWGQRGYDFLPEFLDVLALNYGAGLRLVDYMEAPEEARQIINHWVSDQTEERIKDLIPQGAIDPVTKLVLANAIYFNAGWFYPFEEGQTRDGDFNLLGGEQVSVPMMSQSKMLGYAEGEGYQAVALPYVGGEMAMVVLLPRVDYFEVFEDSLSSEFLSDILQTLEMRDVALTMPKFEYESSFQLSDKLIEMGMPNAFGDADFSGMTGTRELFISEVVHKAFISVDEEGTEAAAATAVIMPVSIAPTPAVEVTIDRPFIYMIRDLQTGTILFVGRILNPVE
ncbi:MAG: serpin family protein [Anaerolineales bacterium]|nr:serpin family protein [Anaerolineales bacterium]